MGRTGRKLEVPVKWQTTWGADATVYEQQIDPSITTEFVGYENLTYASKVTVMTTETEIVEALSDGDAGTIIVEDSVLCHDGRSAGR